MEPLFTTKPEMDRSGMGFSFMEAFMDHICVESVQGEGTTVKMQKTIGKGRKLMEPHNRFDQTITRWG